MNKFFTTCIFIGACFSLFAQQPDTKVPHRVIQFSANVEAPLTATERLKIEEVYGAASQKYVYDNAFRLKSIKNLLRNRIVFKKLMKPSDKKACQKLSEISLFKAFVDDLKRDKAFNPETFNPLKYNFEFSSRGDIMYAVDHTNYYIIVKSQHH